MYWVAPLFLDLAAVPGDDIGIVLCEMIARVSADPDFLPRTNDFGVNGVAFRSQYGLDCPEDFLAVALAACSVAAEVWEAPFSIPRAPTHPLPFPRAHVASVNVHGRLFQARNSSANVLMHTAGTGTAQLSTAGGDAASYILGPRCR